MNGFTAEDFARANLAAAETRAARRVVESQVTEHTLRDSQEKAARKREKLVDHIAGQDRVIRRRNDEIAALRERVRVAESGRLSLDRLEAAWEAAETIDFTGIGEGDLCIERCAERHFEVFRAEIDAEVDGVSRSTIRILSRTPKREPWVELAGVLHDVINQGGDDHIDVDSTAARLYAEGVRVTGGDE